jgi:hypothetical protein
MFLQYRGYATPDGRMMGGGLPQHFLGAGELRNAKRNLSEFGKEQVA